MDVVRITQALKQQNPARYSSRTGSSSNTLSATSTTEPMALHRGGWDGNNLTTNTVHAQEPSTPTSPTAASPSSSFFTLPSFSLSSILPAAVESAGGIFSGSGTAGSRMAGSGSLGEMEVQSLLLRSMPMFGNLISKE
ncbi:hypothetical protein BG003_005755 [Podila horticola]|nr:hypothetical protein BG003_005755 [Podila horticola]